MRFVPTTRGNFEHQNEIPLVTKLLQIPKFPRIGTNSSDHLSPASGTALLVFEAQDVFLRFADRQYDDIPTLDHVSKLHNHDSKNSVRVGRLPAVSL